MVNFSFMEIFELVSGALLIWVAIYLVSVDPFSKLLRVSTGYLISLAVGLFFNPILLSAPDLNTYLKWQKMCDWSIFFIPAFFYHASYLASDRKDKSSKFLLYFGYTFAMFATIIDIAGPYIMNSDTIRFENFRRYDGFTPGSLFLPVILSLFVLVIVGNYFWLRTKTIFEKKNYIPLAGGIILMATLGYGIAGFYIKMNNADAILSIGFCVSALIFIFSILRYYVFSQKEGIILERSFYIKSVLMLGIQAIYIFLIWNFTHEISVESLILYCFVIVLNMFSLSFYSWFSTFLNDLIYNLSSGLSIVNDEEVYQLIKNYYSPQNLEESPLLRLNIVKKRVAQGELPIDALKNLLDEVIKYFKPKTNTERRIKSNLKYSLLHMITYDQADEGQILWNLGFNEYPVRIMSQAGRNTNPQYDSNSPADYTYTSRNAYIALKKEAIHNVAWRISYIEKNS